jgi:hypothetical protein
MSHANHADQSAFDGIGDIDKMDRNVASRPEADIDRSQVMADDRAITT